MQEEIETKDAEKAYESNSIFWVEVEKVVPNPFQPRREFNEVKLNELAESIRMYGVLQPLVVTRKEINLANGAFRTEYELIAGERRLRASRIAGLMQVPVIIRSGKESELMKLELAIIENLQREDLNPVDRALAFQQLASQFGLSHKEIGKRMGRSRVYVANSIRLLGLPDHVLTALGQGELSDGHARTLLMLKDRPEEQDVLFREILLKKLTVREVEHLSRQIATEKVRKRSWKDLEPELKEIERTFSESLGTKVQISKTDYGGKVTIDYFSEEDLQNILKLVRGEMKISDQHASDALHEREVLAKITTATGVEEVVTSAEASSEIPGEETDAPAEVARTMEEELPEITSFSDEDEVMSPVAAPDVISQPIPPVIPHELAIELDDPNDHAIAIPAPHEITTPNAQSLASAQPAAVVRREEEKKSIDDDLYSLSNFSL